MSTDTSLHQTPLYTQHIALGAKMVGFGGWNMPLQYHGILAEWNDNRKTCSLFDCSHMGEFVIQGDAVTSGLDQVVTQNIVNMPLKTCRYGAIANEGGGVIDDCIVYRKAEEEWMIVVNASNIEKDANHIRKHLTGQSQFQDCSFQTAKLDLQGPLSRDVLAALCPGIRSLEYYAFDQYDLLGSTCLISRTGYTGELGYEIYYPWDQAPALWEALLKDTRVRPTGLGVRDVLRIEMCYPLYGHELADDIPILQSGLGKFVEWNKDFIGKGPAAAMKSAGTSRVTSGIVSASRRSPRQHHAIFNEDRQRIGEVTSGTFSPGLNAGIGLCFLEKNENVVEKKIFFGDDKAVCEGKIMVRPFYKHGSLRN